MIEYHYNGVGNNNIEDYAKLFTQAPHPKADMYLYFAHYIIPLLIGKPQHCSL